MQETIDKMIYDHNCEMMTNEKVVTLVPAVPLRAAGKTYHNKTKDHKMKSIVKNSEVVSETEKIDTPRQCKCPRKDGRTCCLRPCCPVPCKNCKCGLARVTAENTGLTMAPGSIELINTIVNQLKKESRNK
jgi:hypothetical protein